MAELLNACEYLLGRRMAAGDTYLQDGDGYYTCLGRVELRRMAATVLITPESLAID